MALIFQQQPSELVLAGNPIEFQVKDTNALKVLQKRRIQFMQLQGDVADGHSFYIAFDDITIDFVFRDNPELATELPTKESSESYKEYIQRVVDAMNRHKEFRSRCGVTLVEDNWGNIYMYIRPNEYNEIFYIQNTSKIDTGGNPENIYRIYLQEKNRFFYFLQKESKFFPENTAVYENIDLIQEDKYARNDVQADDFALNSIYITDNSISENIVNNPDFIDEDLEYDPNYWYVRGSIGIEDEATGNYYFELNGGSSSYNYAEQEEMAVSLAQGRDYTITIDVREKQDNSTVLLYFGNDEIDLDSIIRSTGENSMTITLQNDPGDLEKYLKIELVRPDEVIVTDPVEWDPSGEVDVDIQDAFDNTITGHFNYPSNQTTHIHNIIDDYKLVCYAEDIETKTQTPCIVSKDLYVMPGKLSDMLYGKLQENNQTFLDYISSRKFLTFRADKARTDVYNPERLYILKTGDAKKIVYQVTYDDDTIDSYTHILDTSIDTYTLIEIDASWMKVSDLIDISKTPKSYSVWIEDDSGKTSQTITFSFLLQFEKNARYFLFKNKLGVYESIRTTGSAQIVTQIEKEFEKTGERIQLENYRNYRQKNRTKEVKASCNTGFITPSERERYLEFLYSDDVYWLKKGKAFPVQIEKSKNTIKEDQSNIVSYDFDMLITNYEEDTFDDFGFSFDQPLEGSFNNDFSEGFF